MSYFMAVWFDFMAAGVAEVTIVVEAFTEGTVVWRMRSSCLWFPARLLACLIMFFLPWDHGSWKPNSPGVNWMWQFSNSFQKWAVVTLTQVTSVLVSCWSSVYRKFFEVLFIVNQRGNHIVKNWLPWSGNSLFTSTSFSPLKNPKAFIFKGNVCPGQL